METRRTNIATSIAAVTMSPVAKESIFMLQVKQMRFQTSMYNFIINLFSSVVLLCGKCHYNKAKSEVALHQVVHYLDLKAVQSSIPLFSINLHQSLSASPIE